MGFGASGAQGASSRFSLEEHQACGASVASTASTQALFEGEVIQNRGRGDCLFLTLAHNLPDALEHRALVTTLMTFLRANFDVEVHLLFIAHIRHQFMKSLTTYIVKVEFAAAPTRPGTRDMSCMRRDGPSRSELSTSGNRSVCESLGTGAAEHSCSRVPRKLLPGTKASVFSLLD